MRSLCQQSYRFACLVVTSVFFSGGVLVAAKAATPPTDAELRALADRVWTPKTEAEEQQTYTDIQALPADAFRPLLVYLYKSKYYFDGEGKPYMVGPVRSFFRQKVGDVTMGRIYLEMVKNTDTPLALRLDLFDGLDWWFNGTAQEAVNELKSITDDFSKMELWVTAQFGLARMFRKALRDTDAKQRLNVCNQAEINLSHIIGNLVVLFYEDLVIIRDQVKSPGR